MNHKTSKILLILLTLILLTVPAMAGGVVHGGTATVTLDLTPEEIPPETPPVDYEVISHVIITADDEVKNLGYWVNGDYNSEGLTISGAEVSTITIITNPLQEQNKKVVLVYYGVNNDFENNKFVVTINPHRYSVTVRLHLSMVDIPVTPNPNPNPDDDDDEGEDDGGGNDDDNEDDPEGGNNDPGTNPEPENPKPSNPVNPGRPVVPDTPDVPDVPSEPENPDTPDTPGSDEPLVPILPPAGSVYNLAGFIPLGAGALLLFLAFFWKRKVYRILNSHAKKHGEKPEKEHLKEIADAIIKLVRDDGRYPEWKKNSDVAKRLSADIVSVLDEMNYPKIVPREALATEILKAAKGRLNRHRL